MAKGEDSSEKTEVDLDQFTKDALDEIFSKEEQSYDDLLSRFMFLKKDLRDLEGNSSGANKPGTSQANSHSMHKKAIITVPHEDYGSVPVEVLGPGFKTQSILMRNADSPGGSMLQVDNFVDTEDGISDSEGSGEEDDNSHNCYVYDFAASSVGYSPSLDSNKSEMTKKSTETIQSSKNDDSKDQSSCRRKGPELDKSNNEPETVTIDSSRICSSNLPGEVEELSILEQGDSCESVSPNIRQLQISNWRKDSKHINNNHDKTLEEACDVEPFTLDEDFDYDNVALTPKFNFLQQK